MPIPPTPAPSATTPISCGPSERNTTGPRRCTGEPLTQIPIEGDTSTFIFSVIHPRRDLIVDSAIPVQRMTLVSLTSS